MSKLVNLSGLKIALESFLSLFDNKVDKVNGKGLSTNDLTNTLKSNYDSAYTHSTSGHAPVNAEANQNAFSNIAVGSTTIAADSKTDTLNLVAGDNITITPDAANDKITIEAVNTVYTHPSYTARTGVPTDNQTPSFGEAFEVSQPVSDKTGHITAINTKTVTLPNNTATTTADGLMSSSDKSKLNGIATGANKTTVDSALSTTSTNPVQNKVVTASINTLNDLVGNTSVEQQIGNAITDQKGKATGLAELDANGKVPTSQLPSYVDDVLEYASKTSFPSTGEIGKIYVDTATNKTYRWSGSAYVEISASLALGETSSTAYRGDRGKTAYDHASAKGSAFNSGLYKITTNDQGHVTAVADVVKSDITALGIPAQDTTYNEATTTANGLMSATDKTKLDVTNVAYGKCGTAAGTAAKVVSTAGNTNWALVTGSMVTVAFSATNTAQNPTLNVNGTGAKSIYYNGSTITTSNLSYAGHATRPITFIYDGEKYRFMCWGTDNNSDTKVTQQSTSANNEYPLLLAPNDQAGFTGTKTTTSFFDGGVTLNPSTNTIAANISGNAATADAPNVNTIAENSDLNDLITAGIHVQATITTAKTIVNNPLSNLDTGILVKVYSSGTGVTYQELHGIILGGIWKRRRANSTWSEWIQIATTEDKVAAAATADKLSTARTIALSGGATGTATSFDGSKDISIPVTKIDPAYIGEGYSNKRWFLNVGPESNGVIVPYLFNSLVHLQHKGGSVALTYDGVAATPNDLGKLFNGSIDYFQATVSGKNQAVFELTLPSAFTWAQIFYIDFYSASYRAKDIKLEVINTDFADDVWTQKASVTDHAYGQYYTTLSHTPVGATNAGSGFNKIRITLSNWQGSNLRISSIGMIHRTAGLEETCLSRAGGEMYGNITPYTNGTGAIGTSTKRWNNIYGNQIFGNFNGGLKSVNDTTLTQELMYHRGGVYGDTTNGTFNSPYGNYTDGSGNQIDYGSLLRLRYETKYYTDIWADANIKSGLVYRQVVNGTSQGWKTILDSHNYSNYIQAATDDEILALMQEMGSFPLLTDENGNIYTDENEAILLI